ncbi:MAG: tetratricopeptide repeat protein [Nitrospinae bacterium]|nr:tetratricopeptide repeat protein [Nitrospinota bacterium]
MKKSIMKRCLIWKFTDVAVMLSLLTILLLQIFSATAAAEKITFSAELIYKQGKYNDKETDRFIAKRMLKKALQAKLVTSIEKMFTTESIVLSKEEINGIAAFILLPEVKDNFPIFMARTDIVTEDALMLLNELREDKPRLREFAEVERNADYLFSEADRINGLIETGHGIDRSKLSNVYTTLINSLIVIDYLQNGYALLFASKYEDAARSFDAALAIDTNNPYIYHGRGLSYLKSGSNMSALLDFTKAIELNPKYAWAYNNRGIAYAVSGKFKQAMLDFKKALELDDKYAEAHYNLGHALADNGSLQDAVDEYTKAIVINPAYNEAYANRGVVLDSLGKYNEALDDCKLVIARSPKKSRFAAEVHYNCGLVYAHMGRFQQALNDLDIATSLEPKFVAAYNVKGMIHLQLGEMILSIDDFGKAIELEPKTEVFYKHRGLAYHDLGYIERAIDDFDKAIEIMPGDSEAYLLRGIAYINLNKPGRALADIDKAVELDKHPDAYYNRALCNFILKNTQRAIIDLDRAIELNSKYDAAYFLRGKAFLELKDEEKGLTDINTAANMGYKPAENFLNERTLKLHKR